MFENLLNSIPNEQKIEMLRNNWISHDAKWQMQVVKNFGWEVGNKLNQETIKEMGRIMMYRMINTLGVSKIQTIEVLKTLLIAVITLSYPSAPKNIFQVICKSKSALLIRIEKCSTHENIKKVGATQQYECACFALRSGFFKALNLNVEQTCQKSLMKGDNKCEICLKVEKWVKEDS